MRHELIGYVLGALDPAEQALIEQRLAQDEDLRRELERVRASLELLRSDDDEPPPPGLTASTCEAIEAYDAEHQPSPARREMQRVNFAPSSRGKWRFADMLVTSGICMAAALLFFPAIASSRFQSNIVACQENLTQIGRALQAYGSFHNGYLPTIPTHGNEASAGLYAVTLRDHDLITDDQVFLCPDSEFARSVVSFQVPTIAQLRRMEGQQLRELQRAMGGSYAYTLGYSDGERYYPTQNAGRSYFVIMADAPAFIQGMPGSNHGGCGQNVLFEDFHIQFLSGCSTVEDGDAFFVNNFGCAAAGADSEDAVVGSSHVSPVSLWRP